MDAHGEGVGGSVDRQNEATPPGLYECTKVVMTGNGEGRDIWNSYGAYYVYLQEMEGQESGRQRSGVGMHGGGSASPNPLAGQQGFYATNGCVRLQNQDLPRLVTAVRTSKAMGGTTYLTVTWTC